MGEEASELQNKNTKEFLSNTTKDLQWGVSSSFEQVECRQQASVQAQMAFAGFSHPIACSWA